MLPRDQDIANLAIYAPRLAYAMIIGVPRVPFVGDLPVQFTTSSVDAPPVITSLDNNLTQDTLIERISYSVFQPQSFSGSVFQAQYFKDLKACTGVGVQLTVYGAPKYDINVTPTPLENIADVLAVTWPSGWPLAKQSNVKLSAVLLQTPTSVPYDVYVTLLGWQWLDKAMDDMSDSDARARLRSFGITSPDIVTPLNLRQSQ